MSNDTQKADHIAHRLYSKLTSVVNHGRASAEPSPQAKVDKWFNIETTDAEAFKEQTRIYRSISSLSSPSSFELQVLLCIPELTANQVLAYLAPDSSRAPVDPSPRYILLESWRLDFSPHQPQPGGRHSDDRPDVAPPTMYKHGISLFRSVFTLLRILPAWKLSRRARRAGGNRNGHFTIQVRVESSEEGSAMKDTLGFESLVQNTRLPHKSHEFSAVPHPKGSLALSVTYLTTPNFQVFDRESLLSSRFLSQDEGPEFTPTLLKNQQRDSLASSPGSLPMRTSLPRSPPSSVADRFVITPSHSHSRTTSMSGGSPRLHSVALPMARAMSAAGPATTPGSVSGISDTSSVRQGAGSREDVSPSAVIARLRRESLGRTDAAGPLPIRRPALPPVNPFKSSTLSSGSPSLHSPSPSLRQSSPLSTAGPSLPSRPAQSSPTSSRAPALPSPIGAGASVRLPATPMTPLRPSPPLGPSSLSGAGPSSLGDRKSIEGTPGTPGDSSPRMPGTKRYVSSFGHRYTTSAVGSEASSSSGVTPAERVASASYLSTNTDDDDISDFVQQIDARKPLSSLREQASQESTDTPVDPPPVRSGEPRTNENRPLSSAEPMLVTADAVDERLRQMNETFMASLQGLGSRRRERRETEDAESSAGSTTVRAPSSGPSTLGRRTLDPITFASRRESPENIPPLLRRPSGNSGHSAAYGFPPAYVRPRLASTGSARSGMSIASEEVLGRMDPEFDDERRRSRTARDFP